MRSLFLAALLCAARAQVRDPPYFNVALNKAISATATCGQLANGTALREQFCELTLTGTEDAVCGFCDASRNGEEHPIAYAVDGSARSWQSPPLSRGRSFHEVNITIDLGQVCCCECVHVCSCLCCLYARLLRSDLCVLHCTSSSSSHQRRRQWLMLSRHLRTTCGHGLSFIAHVFVQSKIVFGQLRQIRSCFVIQ